jgi:hypothetical protein
MSGQATPVLIDDIPVIGSLPARKVASKLRQMGDAQGAQLYLQRTSGEQGDALFGWGEPKAWEHTAHQFGFIAPPAAGAAGPIAVQPASTMQADLTLKNSRINVHLDRLRIYDYPGGGEHSVMFTCMAQNQIEGTPELVSFSQIYAVQEKQAAGVAGWPVFIGLSVGTLGVAFQLFTTNVKNKTDEAMLAFLDSPPFQGGLNLLKTLQPAIKPFTEMTLGVARSVLSRNRNVPVQKFYLGLDFTQAALGVRLAQGNYIAAQVPDETALNWDDWVYAPASGAIVAKADNTTTLPFNYVIFRVTRYEGDQ